MFVFPDAIYLDYRMGKEWGAAELGALFELHYQAQSCDKNVVVTLPPEYSAEAKERFATAFSEYRRYPA